MYRAITLLALEDQIPLHDGRLLGELAAGADLAFVATDDGLSRILVRGRDVSVAIRSPEVTAAVSEVSAHGPVRAALTLRQRELAGFGHSVLEGRDIGTVVCPDADVKVFLTASLSERARRRSEQYAEQGVAVDAEQVERDIAARDRYDSGRRVAPLSRAADAIEFDTTALSIDEVVDRLCTLVRGRRGDTERKAANE
jgi:cytidylate kinase